MGYRGNSKNNPNFVASAAPSKLRKICAANTTIKSYILQNHHKPIFIKILQIISEIIETLYT